MRHTDLALVEGIFGESDAIIVTSKTAYLVGSKRDKRRIPNRVLTWIVFRLAVTR